MNPLESPSFFALYRFVPHQLVNRVARLLMTRRRPTWLVQRAIRVWVRRARIDLGPFEPRAYETLEEVFLRRRRTPVTMPERGLASPADGRLVAKGPLTNDVLLTVKGETIRASELVGCTMDPGAYREGAYAVVFLTPSGYHYVHVPLAAELVEIRYVPGRSFPQNERALEHIPRVYLRNERAAMRFRTRDGSTLFIVMIGASLIGQIHLRGIPQSEWMRARPCSLRRPYAAGDELGHFTFGSTVAMLLSAPLARAFETPIGAPVRVGQLL